MTETPSSSGGVSPKTYTAFFYGKVTHGIFFCEMPRPPVLCYASSMLTIRHRYLGKVQSSKSWSSVGFDQRSH